MTFSGSETFTHSTSTVQMNFGNDIIQFTNVMTAHYTVNKKKFTISGFLKKDETKFPIYVNISGEIPI